MTTVAPFHLINGEVYHVRDDCGQWNAGNRLPGTADRKVCLDCLVLLVRERGR